MRRNRLYLLPFFFTGACEGGPPDAFIMRGKAGLPLLSPCSRAAPAPADGSWTPDWKDVARLEAALPMALSRAPEASALDPKRVLANYRRQYAGVLRRGERFLYGSFSPKTGYTPSADLQKLVVETCDGGPAYFGIEMNMSSRQISHLAFDTSLISPADAVPAPH